jgi:hypothetical protein
MKVDSITLSATIHGLTVGRQSMLAGLAAREASRRSAGLLAVLIHQFTRCAPQDDKSMKMLQPFQMRLPWLPQSPSPFS